jgi:hypothetical protein
VNSLLRSFGAFIEQDGELIEIDWLDQMMVEAAYRRSTGGRR